jgi:hypothetical protein
MSDLRFKWLAICTVALAVAVAGLYFSLRVSTVLVENQSTVSLLDIHIELGNEIFWNGTLAPGASHREFGLVKPDDAGGGVISFTAKGVRYAHSFPSGFMSWGNHHRLKITPTFEVEDVWVK